MRVRGAACNIFERKGYTNWAIALVIVHLLRTILNDQKRVLPLSVRLNGEYRVHGVCLSIPAAVAIDRVGKRVLPAINEEEFGTLRHSAPVPKQNLATIRVGCQLMRGCAGGHVGVRDPRI